MQQNDQLQRAVTELRQKLEVLQMEEQSRRMQESDVACCPCLDLAPLDRRWVRSGTSRPGNVSWRMTVSPAPTTPMSTEKIKRA